MIPTKFNKICLSLFCLFFFVAIEAGQNAAPSSHFVFDDNFDGDILINEVRVPKEGVAMYTYYEALGWRGGASGYAGIQKHPRGNNFIFSIWDHRDHKGPIRAVHRGPGTITEKFGGEGTGLKSWNFELGWDPDVWYTLVSRSWASGDHTFYGFWAKSEKTKVWTHLVTMDVASKDVFNSGLIPISFLFIFLFSVKAIILKFLLVFADLMSCLPILPIQPVIAKLIFFIIL